MKTKTSSRMADGAIWERILKRRSGNLTPEAAESLLLLYFDAEDRDRMNLLAERARDGVLSPDEKSVAETYNRVAHLLALLQSEARRALRAPRKNHR